MPKQTTPPTAEQIGAWLAEGEELARVMREQLTLGRSDRTGFEARRKVDQEWYAKLEAADAEVERLTKKLGDMTKKLGEANDTVAAFQLKIGRHSPSMGDKCSCLPCENKLLRKKLLRKKLEALQVNKPGFTRPPANFSGVSDNKLGINVHQNSAGTWKGQCVSFGHEHGELTLKGLEQAFASCADKRFGKERITLFEAAKKISEIVPHGPLVAPMPRAVGRFLCRDCSCNHKPECDCGHAVHPYRPDTLGVR